MLGSTKLTALLGSAPDATADNAVLKAYTKTLQNDAGLALFLVVPDGKVPADCRTTQAKNKAIKEAAEAGEPKPTGLHMATHNATHLGRWIDKYRKDRDPDTPVNMALEVGRSRLVVIDVDTVAELDAFRQTWAERSGDPALAWVAPTVSSPASRTPTPGSGSTAVVATSTSGSPRAWSSRRRPRPPSPTGRPDLNGWPGSRTPMSSSRRASARRGPTG